MIERREFFDERGAAAEVLRDSRAPDERRSVTIPSSQGAYWALDAATKVAEVRIRDPGSPARLLTVIRESLAHATESGEVLPLARKGGPHAR